MSDKDTKYEYGADLSAEPVPVLDPAIGKTVTLRVFDFKIPNNYDVANFPRDKQKIFSDHASLIKTMLWADGLVPYEGDREITPKVIVSLKKRTFRIIVAAQARFNTMFIEKPRSLTEMLAGPASKAHKNGTAGHRQ